MAIYLMQHGKPAPKEEDPTKPLSKQGVEDVEKVASFLKKRGIKVGRIFHSGKTRAAQTAEIMAARLIPGGESAEMKGLSPLDDVESAAEALGRSREDTLIVGHLPHLARLTSLLTAGNKSLSVAAFQQGGVVCLRQDAEGKGRSIAWMLVPEIVP